MPVLYHAKFKVILGIIPKTWKPQAWNPFLWVPYRNLPNTNYGYADGIIA